jgi:DNA-binding beta-propeller fold protein YncE
MMMPIAATAETPAAVRTGNGDWIYEIVPGWGTLPGGPIGPTHGGVVVDRQTGNVFVSTNAAHGILVFKPDGTPLPAIAPQCQDFHAMEVHVEDGKTVIYGAQLGGPKPLRVCKIDTAGNELLEISEATAGKVEGGWNGLTALTVAPDGSIFVGMGYGSSLVHKFSAKGEHLLTFGGTGQEDGKFRTCHGLAIDTRFGEPRLLVVDRENHRLVHFDFEGKWLGTHSANLRRPCNVTFHGEFCAVAELAGRVTILDKTGTPVAFLGDNPNHAQRAQFKVPLEEIAAGVFTSPHGITFDGDGNLYVQVWNQTGLVVKLQKAAD